MAGAEDAAGWEKKARRFIMSIACTSKSAADVVAIMKAVDVLLMVFR